ncbi:MAG: type I DNA topoisomerase [Verrucomicrobia bacterium]|jgi:DNA topoisomerase I|nr:type I DNA topoisomerase [Verrucomicrobiota bacterium]
MGKKLVIVESPAKAKTINKILGKDYIVKSSMGHIRDLPVKSLGVDVKDGFKPTYVMVKTRKKVVDELKAAAKSCDAIYLAPDPDREGEAIAWHLKEMLSKIKANAEKPFVRVQYNEITPRAVKAAFENPVELEMPRVDAQQARRVLDRIVGYMVSPLLWRRVQRGLSAGRVQSVALRLVCEREQQIQEFKPETFWVFGALVRKLIMPLEPFSVKLAKINGEKAVIGNQTEADKVRQELDGAALKVAGVKTRNIQRKPQPPFITSTLQQAASNVFSFSPKRTMGIAQKLYEGVNLGQGPTGLITYMRTDSVSLSQDAITTCRTYVEKTFGNEYLPEKPNLYKSRSGAQEAHEAIRPTDVTLTPDKVRKHLDAPEFKLYQLIWQRFVGCQMTPAKIEQRTIEIEASPKAAEGEAAAYLFTATASEVKFPGHRKVTGEKDKKKADSDELDVLPAVTEGEPLMCLELLSEEKQTQPPSRYSEASLVKALESNGVGRPSTYASIISTLEQRKYVEIQKRSLLPSGLGMKTSALLVSDLGDLFDVKFTAAMEESLDQIEHGDVDWTEMLAKFYEQFSKWMEATKAPPADQDAVRRVVDALDAVEEWAPPVKRGKRTYSDEKFVKSIGETLEHEEKQVSTRQFEALGRIACRYREKLPVLADVLTANGLKALLDEPLPEPPRESSIKKLELLLSLELDEGGRDFAQSLADQAKGGRRLSPAQLKALDRMVLANSVKIEGFEGLKESLDLVGQELPEDNESPELIQLMSTVEDWKPPVKRGKREFNDETFFASLSQQLGARGYLSDRQRAALKRMIRRYREQVPTFEEVAERLDLNAKPKRSFTGKGKAEAQPVSEGDAS